MTCLFPTEANAQVGTFDDVIVKSVIPQIIFRPSNNISLDWCTEVGASIWNVDSPLNNNIFEIHEDAASQSLVIDDGSVTSNQLFQIRKAGGVFVAFEHTDTAQTFHIRSLSSNDGLFNGGVGLSTDSSLYPLWVFGTARSETLALREEGVGVGTYESAAPLHVYADGSPFDEARVLVETNVPTTSVREMLELANNGGVRVALSDTSRGSKWSLSSDGGGKFTISLIGTGGTEFSIQQNGRVIIGPGGVKNLDLRPNGNLRIKGTLTQSSDRNLKTAFADVDAREVLQNVVDMPITTWEFKSDEPGLRHMGPTAQDFWAAFELGTDETTIAPVDGVGVALASIKALNQKLEERDQHIEQLNAKLAAEQELLEAQTHMLETQGRLLAGLSERLEVLESATAQD